jgi:hypothetical protein
MLYKCKPLTAHVAGTNIISIALLGVSGRVSNVGALMKLDLIEYKRMKKKECVKVEKLKLILESMLFRMSTKKRYNVVADFLSTLEKVLLNTFNYVIFHIYCIPDT